MYKLIISMFTLCLFGLYNCDSKDQSDATPLEGETDVSDAPEIGALAIDIAPYQVMKQSVELMSSSKVSGSAGNSNIGVATAGALAPSILQPMELLDSEEAQDSIEKGCSNQARPWDEGKGELLNESDPRYSERSFYCFINADAGSESLKGSVGMYQGILCEFEKLNLDYTTEGNKQDVSITLTTDCFTSAQMDRLLEGKENSIPISLTLYDLGIGSEWDKRINIIGASPAGGIDFYFKVSPSIIAFKMVEPHKTLGKSMNSVTIDRQAGTVSFEKIQLEGGGRVRLFMSGVLNDDNTFKYIEEVKGIKALFGPVNGEINASIATVKGSVNDGLKYRNFNYLCRNNNSCDSSNWLTSGVLSELDSNCLPSDLCDYEEGINIESNDLKMFTLNSEFGQDTSSVSSWMDDSAPLCFDTVTKDLTSDDICEPEGLTLLGRSSFKKAYIGKTRYKRAAYVIKTAGCSSDQGMDIKTVYAIDLKNIKNAQQQSIINGAGHKIAFGIGAAHGSQVWSDYEITLTALLDKKSVGSLIVKTPDDKSKQKNLTLDIDLTGITDQSILEVRATGKHKCGGANTKRDYVYLNTTIRNVRLLYK